MITIKLIGGQGNQMFQYAYGRRLSILKGEELKLDTTSLLSRMPRNNFTFRDYELGVFNIENNFTPLSKIAFHFGKYIFIIQIIKNKLLSFFLKDRVLDEVKDPINIDDKALRSRHNLYISGLFDKERYLSDIDEVIRKDFSFRKQPEGRNEELASDMESVNSVSLHIRRGDLVDLGYTICDSDYYQKAIDYIYQKVDNPIFYIFSDDPEWARNNLKIKTKHFIVDENKGHNSYIDMQLISLCKHNIIANSTFSWWGAWLNINDTKIVITPKEYAENHEGLMPLSWLKF